jgi:hypothetical protein
MRISGNTFSPGLVKMGFMHYNGKEISGDL